ncbi:DUF2165 family protein [Ancylobacter defluvii]|uniref:Small integral membrane protein n=1 Tax=Ancylobacter defluvii TaxID=1282440 RepID=A0A9W6N913_9HYPH|nr:DUF2165 domain-containing protein [Ancylobacter defluvii]MBS7589839.1 DUF2165 domain-containing protein [Ancylobacter defluvii]GLK82959.1 hypothetical protein GCM10017653_10280 [Ancylobacter defluvii]
MIVVRLTKSFMVAALAAFALLVAYNNVADWGANYAFVQHVLSMDTTFPGNPLTGRAVTDPALWRAAYVAIIAAEAGVGVVLGSAALRMLLALRDEDRFARAKIGVVAGVGLGFALWFFGFMVVGGEYFQMWQSSTWNGQESAFRFYMTMLAVVIFVSLPEPGPRAASPR